MGAGAPLTGSATIERRRSSRLALVVLVAGSSLAISIGANLPGVSAAPGWRDSRQQAESRRHQPFYQRPFGHQPPVSVASKNWSITMIGSAECGECPGGKAWVFTALRKDGGESYKIRLTNSPTQVDELALVDESRLVVFGRNTANAVLVNVLRLPQGAELDSFMCYSPALSPDHRFLAYLKPFPGHPGPVDITNEYVLYDLTGRAASNRVRGGHGIAHDAGIPVYPPGATNAAGEFVAPNEWSAHVMASDGLFWLGETDAVAFVDRWQGTNSLVVVDLSRGVHRPRLTLTVRALETGSIVDMADCRNKAAPSDLENWSKAPASLISVTDISLSSTGAPQVRLTLAPHPCLRSTTVDVPLDVASSTSKPSAGGT